MPRCYAVCCAMRLSVEGEGGELISTVVTQGPFSRFWARPHFAALFGSDVWDPGLFRGWVALAD
ncbi:MAG: hypothetical protein ACE1ZX_03615, partial [Acidimicrobiia bacterium]